MDFLLGLKEKCKELYARNAAVIDIIAKALVALLCFFWIRTRLAVSPLFSNVFVILVAALLCAVLPWKIIPLMAGVFIIGQAFAIGMDVGALVAVIFLILYLLFLRFVEEEAIVFILQPMAMFFGLPALLPIVLGLRRRPSSMLAVLSGCICAYLLENLQVNAQTIAGAGVQDYLERLQLILGGLVSNKEMIVQLLALAGVLLIVYAVRKLGFNHAPIVSVITGALVYLLFVILGNAVVGTSFVIPVTIIGLVITIVLAALLQFFLVSVDYRGATRVSFEDDDYVYFVKAVPKMRAGRLQETEDTERNRDNLPGDVDFEEKLTKSLERL